MTSSASPSPDAVVPDAVNAALAACETEDLRGLLAAFHDVADLLMISADERAGILGLPLAELEPLSRDPRDADPARITRCVRRLRYSVPLLCQMLRNRAAPVAPVFELEDAPQSGGMSGLAGARAG